MSRKKFDVFSKAGQSGSLWLKQIARDLGADRHVAWRALAAVLHALRDRMTEQQVAHLGGQLPLLVRGLFFEEWKPAKPQRIRKRQEFLDHVAARLKRVDSARATAAVFAALDAHVSEFHKILKTMPPAISALAIMPDEAGASAFDWE